MKARLLISLFVISSASILLLPAAPAGGSFPGTNGRIAYYDFIQRPSQIYTIDPDGTDALQLTTGTRAKVDPAWSADGTKIAFGSRSTRRTARGRLETMNADGSQRTTVVAYDGDRLVFAPSWSPDGMKIAFCVASDRPAHIWVVNADGSGLTRLSGRRQDDCGPDWSPDGSKIAFHNFGGGLFVMDADGSNRRRLVLGHSENPSWSPDGTRIAVTRSPTRGSRFDLLVVNADGTGRTWLTSTDRRWEFTPAWSPDGDSIAFCRGTGRGVDSPCEIWIIGADGSNPTKITATTDIDEFHLSWQAT